MSNPFGPPSNYDPSPYGPPPASPYSPVPPYGSPGPYGPPPGPPGFGKPLPAGTVKSYLVESIIALLCCAGVIAIPAIIFAAQVDGHLRQGNYHAALDASNKAKMWLMIAVGIGVALFLFCTVPVIFIQFLAIAAGA